MEGSIWFKQIIRALLTLLRWKGKERIVLTKTQKLSKEFLFIVQNTINEEEEIDQRFFISTTLTSETITPDQ